MTTVTNYRNAVYKSTDNSIIDLEIETEEYGWIPTTIHPNYNDNQAHIVQIKQWLVDNAGLIAPYVAPPPPTQAELDAQAKQAKIEAVSQITVTTSTGKTFDGDEDSQNRMARAVTASSAGESTLWKMANNLPDTVTHEELKEALRLAGDAMTLIWVN